MRFNSLRVGGKFRVTLPFSLFAPLTGAPRRSEGRAIPLYSGWMADELTNDYQDVKSAWNYPASSDPMGL